MKRIFICNWLCIWLDYVLDYGDYGLGIWSKTELNLIHITQNHTLRLFWSFKRDEILDNIQNIIYYPSVSRLCWLSLWSHKCGWLMLVVPLRSPRDADASASCVEATSFRKTTECLKHKKNSSGQSTKIKAPRHLEGRKRKQQRHETHIGTSVEWQKRKKRKKIRVLWVCMRVGAWVG